MEWYEEILSRCSRDMTIWLLYLAEHPHKVGIGKTSDYHTLEGSVSAYAGKHDLDPFNPRKGYKELCRTQFHSPVGTQTFFLEDKPDLVRLTKMAIGILTRLATSNDLRMRTLEQLGVRPVVPERWFPVTVKPEAPVLMSTTTPHPGQEPFTMRVNASYLCERCGSRVAHSYEMEWRTDEWVTVRSRCPVCALEWEHMKGFPYGRPTPCE